MASLFRGYLAYRQEELAEDEEDKELFGHVDEDPVDIVIVRSSVALQWPFFDILAECFSESLRHHLGTSVFS